MRLIILCAFYFISGTIAPMALQNACAQRPESMLAPVNPAFTAFHQKEEDLLLRAYGAAENGFGLGYIPGPIAPEIHEPDTQLEIEGLAPCGASAGDAEYDMRDPDGDGDTSDSLLTPVRNQGQCNTCWAFTTYGVVESHLKAEFGLSDNSNDYSEKHLSRAHGFAYGPDDGGNMEMGLAYFARYAGPVMETDDPYDAEACTDTSYCTGCDPTRYIDNGVFLPVRSDPASSIDYIKDAISGHGALHTSIEWSEGNFNETDHTFYYDDPTDSFNNSNHCVTIVGWDDDKVTGASQPGAFIVRNSWGDAWGEDGYFYVSYYDESIGFTSLGYYQDTDDSLLSFDSILQYDPLGWTGTIGYGTQRDGWGANRFTPAADGTITGIGLYAPTSGMDYEIQIYDTMTGVSPDVHFSDPLLGTAVSGQVEYRGYYTVLLPAPVEVSGNDPFCVVIKFTDPPGEENKTPIPIERPIGGYAVTSANPGESFISYNGSDFEDVTDYYGNTNVNIKAFFKDKPDNKDMPWIPLLLLDD